MAMAILATGLLLLTNSWTGSGLFMRKTQLNNEMAALLERKMVDIRMEYEGKPLDSIPEEKTDDFGSDYPKYSWKMTRKDIDLTPLAGIASNESGGSDQMETLINQTIFKFLSDSTKEVKVSVIYKEGKKHLEVSATTYFVDYDKEISIPGMGSLPGGGAGGNGGSQ